MAFGYRSRRTAFRKRRTTTRRPRTYKSRRYGLKRMFGRTMDKRSEFKTFETTVQMEVNSAGVFQLLNGLDEGVGKTERIGTQFIMRSFQVVGKVVNKTTAASSNPYRISVVYDRNPNGAFPDLNDIYEGISTLSPRNLDNVKRFQILYTARGVVSKRNLDLDTKLVNFYRRIYKKTICNDAAQGDITDIMQGGLYLIVTGDNASGDNAADFTGYVRMRFIDM